MNIQVVATAGQANEKLALNQTVVVIDVLRATSVITTALYNGSGPVWPVAGIDEAHQLFQTFSPGSALRGGERGGKIIPGFELGNSPLSYTHERIQGQNIILSTTNGTLAIHNSLSSKDLYLISFLNLNYAASMLTHVESLIIVCSGTNGQFSADDALCAGMLIQQLEKKVAVTTDDLGLVVKHFARQPGSIPEKLTDCFHLKYLQSLGYQADIDYCLQTNFLPLLPALHADGSIRAL